MIEVNKIARIQVKEVWRYEDRDLTPWLCDNIDVIGDSISVQLTNAVREQSTGNFNVDIKAEDLNGNFFVIENQFGSSDHDHLGKLITYMAAFGAKAAIWIVETPRQEHISAINWLNESSNGCDFYLLKLEAIRIGESAPAPLITKIVGPSEEAKKLGSVKKEDAERFDVRLEFWHLLLAKAKVLGLHSFSASSPTKDAFVGVTAGVKGLSYMFWSNQKSIRIELRIDGGKGSEKDNIEILNSLKQHQSEIETVFGEALVWADLEGYRVCSIRKDYDLGGYKSPEPERNAAIENAIKAMLRLEKATRQFAKSSVKSRVTETQSLS
jgi:hypothetical protein